MYPYPGIQSRNFEVETIRAYIQYYYSDMNQPGHFHQNNNIFRKCN